MGRIRYPHMKPREVEIWKKYLRAYGERFEYYDYDLHVGEGCGPVPGLSEKYQDMAKRLSQKRIDVVGYIGDRVYIIELKPVADMEAIGQLKVYKTLYEDKYGSGSAKGLIIVAEKADQDIRRSAKEQDIEIMLV